MPPSGASCCPASGSTNQRFFKGFPKQPLLGWIHGAQIRHYQSGNFRQHFLKVVTKLLHQRCLHANVLTGFQHTRYRQRHTTKGHEMRGNTPNGRRLMGRGRVTAYPY